MHLCRLAQTIENGSYGTLINHRTRLDPVIFPGSDVCSVAAIVLASGLAVAAWVFFGDRGRDGNAVAAGSALKLEDIPFNGARAYEYLKQLCAIGPRPSGSPGMEAQQKLLAEHFKKLGGQVEFQRFRVPPSAGRLGGADGEHHGPLEPGKHQSHPVVRPLRHAALSDAGPGEPARQVRRRQRQRQRRGRC